DEVGLVAVAEHVVGRLTLVTAPHADDAPTTMVVDRRRLAGLPHERDDRVAPFRVHVHEMRPVATDPRLLVTSLEQIRVRERRPEYETGTLRDHGRIVVGLDDRIECARQTAEATGA